MHRLWQAGGEVLTAGAVFLSNRSAGTKAAAIAALCVLLICVIYGFFFGNPLGALSVLAGKTAPDDFLKLVSLAVVGLAGLCGILWRNFISSSQLKQQIVQTARTAEQIRLTEAKNNADLFAKACEMVGKDGAAEVTGGINLLRTAAEQEKGKYAKSVIAVLEYAAAQNEGQHTKQVIRALGHIALFHDGKYAELTKTALDTIGALYNGRFAADAQAIICGFQEKLQKAAQK